MDSALPTTLDPATDVTNVGPTPAANRPWSRLVPVFLTLIAAAYLLPFVDRGWVPHDEGLLGQSAERVLNGEFPHRDFDDTYTGGQSFLHALAFRLLGIKLESLRWFLFIGTLAFVPAVYSIAVRVSSPWLAALVTANCVIWSVPNYFAAMPSWYVLFLTTFGVALLLRYLDTGQRRWLFAAGLCGGLSLLLKIVGLYFVAAALMFLAFHESQQFADREHARQRSWGFLAFVTLIGGALLALVFLLLRRGGSLDFMAVVHFLVPCAAVCLTLILCESRSGHGPFVVRFGHLTKNVAMLVGGVLLPVVLFAILYGSQGELGRLVEGVIVLPQLRFEFTHVGLPPALTLVMVLIPTLVFWMGLVPTSKPRLTVVSRCGVAVLVGLLLLFGGARYYEIWYSLRGFLPMAAIAACCLLVWQRSTDPRRCAKQELFLVTATAVLFSLIQYPEGRAVYFCYCVPLVLLTTHFAVSAVPRWQFGYVALLVLYGVFGVGHLNRGYWTLPADKVAANEHRLNLEKASLNVSAGQQHDYEAIVGLIHKHSPANAPIFAAPDCPQIYFLSDRRNPTRAMYDFFDSRPDRTSALVAMLSEKQIQVVVINLNPVFSPPIDARLDAAIRARLPHRTQVGDFVVAWRSPSPDPRHANPPREDSPVATAVNTLGGT